MSALAGFVLGSPEGLAWWKLAFTLIGTVLTAGGVGAWNHFLEYEIDGEMRRTAGRPLPAGRVSPKSARAFGSVLIVLGVGLLCPLTNPLTGVLAAVTVLLYLFVYTPLKQVTKYNTIIGTIPGALPALGGWTAATGTISWGGIAIFLILAFWQMPHFLALAWMYRKDYERGGFAMLTVVEPDGRSTGRQTLGFTIALIGVAVVPTLLGIASVFYLAGSLIIGLDFLRPSYAFSRSLAPQDARRVLMASIRYIPLLVALIVADHLLFL